MDPYSHKNMSVNLSLIAPPLIYLSFIVQVSSPLSIPLASECKGYTVTTPNTFRVLQIITKKAYIVLRYIDMVAVLDELT